MSVLVLFVGMLTAWQLSYAASSLCSSTGSNCLSGVASCTDLEDGDYQACEGCTFYHSCAAGVLWPFRDCPLTTEGGIDHRLVWVAERQSTGFCNYTSNTCKGCTNAGGNNLPPIDNGGGVCTSTGSRCITASPSSCTGRPDGNYQACEGCTFFHSCVAGYLNYAFRDCAATNQGGINGKLVWDDNLKRCEYESTTCRQCNEQEVKTTTTTTTTTTTRPTTTTEDPCAKGKYCVDQDCRYRLPGDYQSCQSCHHYISCNGTNSWMARPCPTDPITGELWVWVITSETQGYCDKISKTCNQCSYKNKRQLSDKQPFLPSHGISIEHSQRSCHTGTASGHRCLDGSSAASCLTKDDGDYQDCSSCSVYHTCDGGVITANRACPAGLVWHATSFGSGICDWSSPTCAECK